MYLLLTPDEADSTRQLAFEARTTISDLVSKALAEHVESHIDSPDVTLMTEVAALAHPGHAIRERRNELGWSQQELAERCDVTQADLSRIENGRLDARWSTIQRIMAVLANPANVAQRSLANGGRVSKARPAAGERWAPMGPVAPIDS